MDIHLIDGTYELFRYFFGAPSHITSEGREVGAVRAVANSMLTMVEQGATPCWNSNRPCHYIV